MQSSSTLALIDPPNRADFTDGAPRQLTYAQADRAISTLAAKLCRLGLQTDTVVAIQLPNTVENVITLLAVLRAGMIAVPLPLLWRQHDMTAALRRVGAKAIITTARVGAIPHAEIAMQVAVGLFPVRFICAFGDGLPDGVVPLDDIFAAEQPPVVPRTTRNGPAADHVAVVTFDVTADGLVPVARSHNELMAGGTAVFLESGCGAERENPIGDSALLLRQSGCVVAALATRWRHVVVAPRLSSADLCRAMQGPYRRDGRVARTGAAVLCRRRFL